jgi:putative endonuclease
MTAILALLDGARHRARLGRLSPDQATGKRGEDLAHRFLEARGYRVVSRGFRVAPRGEIDLVAWDGATLVFVEVKTRHSTDFGLPERNLGADQKRSLFRVAGRWLKKAGVGWERARFDLVSVILSEPPVIEHFPDWLRPR